MYTTIATIAGLLLLATSTFAQVSNSSSTGSSSNVNRILGVGVVGDVVASIVTAGPTATIYAASCPSSTASADDTDDTGCGILDTMTITQGPSTYHLSTVFPSYADASNTILNTMIVDCTLSGTTAAICAMTSPAVNGTQTVTSTLASSDLASAYGSVTITAGLEKLAAATATPTGSTGHAGNAAARSFGLDASIAAAAGVLAAALVL